MASMRPWRSHGNELGSADRQQHQSPASMRPWRSHGNESETRIDGLKEQVASMRPWRSHGNESTTTPTAARSASRFNAAVAEPRK